MAEAIHRHRLDWNHVEQIDLATGKVARDVRSSLYSIYHRGRTYLQLVFQLHASPRRSPSSRRPRSDLILQPSKSQVSRRRHSRRTPHGYVYTNPPTSHRTRNRLDVCRPLSPHRYYGRLPAVYFTLQPLRFPGAFCFQARTVARRSIDRDAARLDTILTWCESVSREESGAARAATCNSRDRTARLAEWC